ncbi:hypothetical protein J3A65_002203 [Rhizobium sp. PvP014]|nr:hypothetical protein [Rhizobium sp. PvP014]MBP2528835.1 hypothetical protein [Rhizobium sp. PvP099]
MAAIVNGHKRNQIDELLPWGYRDQSCPQKTSVVLSRCRVTMYGSYGAMIAGEAGAMATYLKAYKFVFSTMACVAQSTPTAFAQIAASNERRVQAAVMLDGLEEPIVGAAHCRIDKRCEIIFGLGSGVKVDVTWRRRETVESADLTIECPKVCSFTSGRSKVTFQKERKFDLFRGAENQVEIEPVLGPRIKIGEIFLIVG